MKIFEKGEHKIIWADAIEALSSEIDDNSIDLVFADPPYNIGKDFNGRRDEWESEESYLRWSYLWLDLCIDKLKASGSLYVMTSTQNMPHFDIYLRKRLAILSRIVWSYDSSGVQARKYYGSLYEPILFCVKNKNRYVFNAKDIMVEARTGAVRKLVDYRRAVPRLYNSKKVPGNVWEIPRVRYRMDEYEEHPTQKPIALLERIVRASSKPGDIVLDPFGGTFTTPYVAKGLGRQSVGIEIEEEYVKIGLRRLEIRSEYKGERLEKKPRSFEPAKDEKQRVLDFSEG